MMPTRDAPCHRPCPRWTPGGQTDSEGESVTSGPGAYRVVLVQHYPDAYGRNTGGSATDVDDLSGQLGDEHVERGEGDRLRGEQRLRRLLAEGLRKHRRRGALGV